MLPLAGTWVEHVALLLCVLKVLDLQDELEAITVEVGSRNITLEDICFAPLSPDNTKCATESVLQYWQVGDTVWSKKHGQCHGINRLLT